MRLSIKCLAALLAAALSVLPASAQFAAGPASSFGASALAERTAEADLTGIGSDTPEFSAPESGTAPRSPYAFSGRQLIAPAALIGLGSLSLVSQDIRDLNVSIRDCIQGENGRQPLKFDNITMLAPIVAAYVPDMFGAKGRHDILDRTIILGSAWLMMGVTTKAVKHFAAVERPDGSTADSFPSGHTAHAFMGAELLRREFGEEYPWIAVAGYAVAAGTGFMRMYNNRHWLTDVLAGAGMGILSVEAAYWLYPLLARTIFPGRLSQNVLLVPCASAGQKGLALCVAF